MSKELNIRVCEHIRDILVAKNKHNIEGLKSIPRLWIATYI